MQYNFPHAEDVEDSFSFLPGDTPGDNEKVDSSEERHRLVRDPKYRDVCNFYLFRFNGYLVSRQQRSKNNRNTLFNVEAVGQLIAACKGGGVVVVYTPITKKSTQSIWKRLIKKFSKDSKDGSMFKKVILLTQEELGASEKFCIDIRKYLELAKKRAGVDVDNVYVYDYEELEGMGEIGATYVKCGEYRPPSRIRSSRN